MAADTILAQLGCSSIRAAIEEITVQEANWIAEIRIADADQRISPTKVQALGHAQQVHPDNPHQHCEPDNP